MFGTQPISGKDVVVAEAITEVKVGDPQLAVRRSDASDEVEEPDVAAAVVEPASVIPVSKIVVEVPHTIGASVRMGLSDSAEFLVDVE